MAPVLYQVITSPPCRAVFMLARAIGLELDLKDVNLAENQHLTPEYLKEASIASLILLIVNRNDSPFRKLCLILLLDGNLETEEHDENTYERRIVVDDNSDLQ
ncbi:putative glutathione s-transferase [Trypoxylus dichotomus]